MFRLTRVLGFILMAVAATQVAALADAYSDMAQVQKAFFALHSFRALLSFDKGRTMQMEFVAPDRWHEIMPGTMDATIIGQTMKVNTHGMSMSIPVPASLNMSLQSMRGWAADKNLKTDYKIVDLGMDGVLHKYEYDGQGAKSFMWVRKDHLPDHIVTTSQGRTTTITYKDYNAPITIN